MEKYRSRKKALQINCAGELGGNSICLALISYTCIEGQDNTTADRNLAGATITKNLTSTESTVVWETRMRQVQLDLS